ncbi:MAG: sulfotransferase [Rhodobacteraceae bacterium]|nr:sulfotransferase [Paracoccaceae bacterium]
MATGTGSVQAAMAEAARLRAAGRGAEARALLESAARAAPRHPGLQLALGEILREAGEEEAALARFKAAAEGGGRDPRLWQRFVTELLRSGRKGRARAVAARAPLAPADRRALVALAERGLGGPAATLGDAPPEAARALQARIAAGRLIEARAEADSLLAAHPRSAFLLNLRGVVALAENDPAGAIPFLRRALALVAGFTEARANLGLALLRAGRTAEAIDILRAAVEDDPTSADARANLASALGEAHRYDEALREIGVVLRASPGDVTLRMIRAQLLFDARRFAEAVEVLDRLEADQGEAFELAHLRIRAMAELGDARGALDYAERWVGRSDDAALRAAMIRAELGQIDTARGLLRKVAERTAANTQVFRTYGMLARWTPDDPLLPVLRRRAGDDRLAPQDRAVLNYALGKAMTDLGDPQAAMQAWHRANAAQDSLLPPQARLDEAWSEPIRAFWTPERLASLRGAGVDSVAPIFIVGLPRSGTTLTEQIIAAHPDVAAFGEDSVVLDHLGTGLEEDWNDLRTKAVAAARALRRAAGGAPRQVDKAMTNRRFVGVLAAAFPQARFVFVSRDLRAVALSMYGNWFDPYGHPYSVDLARMARHMIQMDRMMAHWRALLPDRVHDLSYEELVSDPEPVIRRLIGWLGLPWNDACLSPEEVQRRVTTLSVAQVRAGINTGSARRWEAFARDLEPLTAILRPAGLIAD